MPMKLSEKIKRTEWGADNTCIIVPSYNNDKSLMQVINRITPWGLTIIVVNDGSTDRTEELLRENRESIGGKHPLVVLKHERNQGKGYALRTGFYRAMEMGFRYAITIDSDGQHFPEDIPLFLDAIEKNPETLVVGNRNLQSENMPAKNTFANKFSNFWFYVQTGQKLKDTQTGFRLYPLSKLKGLKYITSRYEAELEILVFAAWNGVKIKSVDVGVYYPPKGERVSHFRPVSDFARISLLNTVLCFGAVVYGLPMRLYHSLKKNKV